MTVLQMDAPGTQVLNEAGGTQSKSYLYVQRDAPQIGWASYMTITRDEARMYPSAG